MVLMPAARLNCPSYAPATVHTRGSGVGWSCTRTKKVVLPYITIRSPGATAPTLIASLSASTAPTATGVPTDRPVAAAACVLISPAISSDQAGRGSASSGTNE
ncbi:hypothetical protein D3C72_1910390 [compost metagenome]